MKHSSTLPLLEAFLAVMLWGVSFVFMKIALRELSPVTVIVVRYGVSALVLGLLTGLRGGFAQLTRADVPKLALLGAVGITLQQWLQVTGQAAAGASAASFLVNTSPAFIVILAALVLREKLTGLQIVGVILACTGGLVVATGGDLPALLKRGFAGSGTFLVLLSAMVWAMSTLMTKRRVRNRPPALVTAGMFFFGWLFTLPFFIIQQGWRELPGLSASGWGALGYIALLSTAVAYLVNTHALQQIAASRVAVIQNVEPLVTVIAAALILQEAVTGTMLIGGAGIIAGVYLAERGAPEVDEIASEPR